MSKKRKNCKNVQKAARKTRGDKMCPQNEQKMSKKSDRNGPKMTKR